MRKSLFDLIIFGELMKVKFCDLSKNYLSIKNEINNEINNVLNSCNYINGSQVNTFENNFASYIGKKYCIGVNSGTDALEIALSSLNLDKDSEVIIQGNTYIATCYSVINNNLKLVLCDVDKKTHMIDLDDLESKITKKTKVIIVVHLYGFSVNMEKLLEICEKYNIILIEDCAQSHGATFNNKKLGSFGKLSCFSFYPSKNLGAYGDGGCILTDDIELNNFIRKKGNMGSIEKYHHEILGRNSRLDTIQASILNVKLKYLDQNNQKRFNNAMVYYDLLKNNSNVILPAYINKPVFHLFVIRVKNRNNLIEYLKNNNIETSIHYPEVLCKNPNLKIDYENKNCIDLCDEIISLPMYPELSKEEIEYVCEKINDFYSPKIETIINREKYGSLHCINELNFSPVRRLFYIDNFENSKLPIIRGNHAIMNFREFLFIIEGKIKLFLTNQNNITKEIELNKNDNIIINPKTWIKYEVLDNKTKIMVLTDKTFEESITHYNFNKFLNS